MYSKLQKDAIDTIFEHYLDDEQQNFVEGCSSFVDKEVFTTELKSHIVCALVIARNGSADEFIEELWEIYREEV